MKVEAERSNTKKGSVTQAESRVTCSRALTLRIW
jgi:hypothetical protein